METKLGILEAKVVEAIGLIKELRAENLTLKNRCRDLQSAVSESEETVQKLTRELTQSRQAAVVTEDFEEKRKEIEDKVGALLEKLEALG